MITTTSLTVVTRPTRRSPDGGPAPRRDLCHADTVPGGAPGGRQSRGGLGIKTMKQDDDRGTLVGGFIVVDGDEVLAIKQSGQVTRSAIDEHLRATSRDTKGVKFVGVSSGDAVAKVARSVESALDNEDEIEATAPVADAPVEADISLASDTIDDDTVGEGAGDGSEDAPGTGPDGPDDSVEETRES